MEEELRGGPANGGGVAACGARDAGAVYLEVVGADAAPRDGGADCRGDHDDVRPAETLALLHGG